MFWILERLRQHPIKANEVPVAMPKARMILTPPFWNNRPKLIFDLAANETIEQRLEKLEALAGEAKGTYLLSNRDFWEELQAIIEGDSPTTLDDSQPLDALRIAFLRAKETVTQNPDEKGGRRFQALLTNQKDKSQKIADDITTEATAYGILASLTPSEKKQQLALAGRTGVREIAKLSDNDVIQRLGILLKADPANFTKAWNDPHRATRYTVLRAIANGLMVQAGENYYMTDDRTKAVAHREDGAIEWLNNPENNSQRVNIERVLQGAEY
jgi:hypothetical protein